MKQKTLKDLKNAQEQYIVQAINAADDADFKNNMAMANRCNAFITQEEDKQAKKAADAIRLQNEHEKEIEKLSLRQLEAENESKRLQLEEAKLKNEAVQAEKDRKASKLKVVLEVSGKVVCCVLTAGLSVVMAKRALTAEYKDNIIVPSTFKEQTKFIQNLKN